jgi:hypothetical protein
MGKLKFLLAICLCVAVLALPLTGVAENPPGGKNNADGHPWDDGSTQGDQYNPGIGPADTATSVQTVRVGFRGFLPGKHGRGWLVFVLTGKWHRLLF